MVEMNTTIAAVVNETVAAVAAVVTVAEEHNLVSPTTMFDFTHALHIDEATILLAEQKAFNSFACYQDTTHFHYHAWHMLALWLIGSVIQLASKRYFISKWKKADIIHAVVGTIIIGGTIWNCFFLYGTCGIKKWDVHVVLGTVCLGLDILLLISGFASYYMVHWHKDPVWSAPRTRQYINKFHWYLGYFLIFFNLGLCFGGALTYASKFLVDSPLAKISFISLGAVIAIQVFSEIWYQRWSVPQIE